jgi:hypothetical protein
MLISIPTDTSTIFGAVHIMCFSPEAVRPILPFGGGRPSPREMAGKSSPRKLFLLLRSNCVRGPLDESLDLHDIVLGQFARKIGHAKRHERTVKDDIFQVRYSSAVGITQVPNIAPFVDSRNAMTESAVADI